MDLPKLQEFETHRRLMFSIAYRMLGSVGDAEDILQEAFLRYQDVPSAEIHSTRAFLSTVVTRLCLNRLDSHKAGVKPISVPGCPNQFSPAMRPPMQSRRLNYTSRFLWLSWCCLSN